MSGTQDSTAEGFVFCIGAVSRFSLSFEMLLRTVMDFNSVNTTIGYVRDFLGTEESWGEESKVGRERMEEMCRNPVEVTLKDVSFSYPDGRTVLSHVNLTVRPGEKLALIGLNGAGKTTLVKLICGFHRPSDGEILVNGIPVRDYGREEYYRLIAVLFQDSFDRMVGKKTAIYISHRLASCRFCEDILVFDHGEVVQRGSHGELAGEPGLYRELWEAQARYYVPAAESIAGAGGFGSSDLKPAFGKPWVCRG